MKLTFTNHLNQSLWINDEQHFSLIYVSGFQPPKASIQLGSLPGVDGSIHLHSKVEQRTIQLTLQLHHDGESSRRSLTSHFKVNQKGTLHVEDAHRHVIIEAWVESCECLVMSWPLKAMISLVCPQPYFEEASEQQLELASITQALSFPLNLLSSGQPLGSLSLSTPMNAYNPGDKEIGFIVRFECVSAVTNPKLINMESGAYLELHTNMEAGQVIEINTQVGHKRIEMVLSSERVNLFSTLSLGSTFFQLKEKDNILLATSELGSTGLMTQLRYRPQYSGV